MELQHTFTVPAPIDRAWSTLMDVEGVAPCFPGAALTGVDGDEFAGTVKVKLGPVSLQYAGKGRFVERDEAAHRVLLEANGTDRRGNGTAGATVTARLEPDGESTTRVVVDTDLKVTGRPAQFGRGVLQDVGIRIIDQFASCLAARMSASPAEQAAGGADTASETSAAVTPPQPAQPGQEEPAQPPEAQAQPGPGQPPAADGAGTEFPAPDPGPSAPSSITTIAGDAPVELDLGAVMLPAVARRYGAAVVAGVLAVFIAWLLRRRIR